VDEVATPLMLGCTTGKPPAEIMTEIFRVLRNMHVSWKKLGPYNLKCLYRWHSNLAAVGPTATLTDFALAHRIMQWNLMNPRFVELHGVPMTWRVESGEWRSISASASHARRHLFRSLVS
jgi:hypothetical protein